MTWTGTLARLDLGPGVWVLKTDDGEQIPLYGDVPGALAGQRVSVEGRATEGGAGIAMVGSKGIRVRRVRATG